MEQKNETVKITIYDIMAKLRLLGTVDNNIENVKIDKYTNEITLLNTKGKSNKTAISKDILIEDYMKYYLFTHRKNGLNGRKIEDTTFASYVDRAKLIIRYIGDIKVADLTFDEANKCINDIHENTCDTTAIQARNILINMMEFAYKDGVITDNVLLNNKITLKESKKEKEKKIIQKEDIRTFIEYCKEHKYYDLLFDLNTGIRASELAGLTWDNIDFEHKTITLNKAYMRIIKQKYEDGKIVTTRVKDFKDLKSKNSYRTIGIGNDEIWEMLKVHKEDQKQLATKLGKKFRETDWVFTTKSYKGYVADYLGDKFRKVMNEIKIKNYKELTPHKLRHTYCTYGIMGGTPLEQMSKIMGHSSTKVTENVYLHINKQQTITASNTVSKLLATF